MRKIIQFQSTKNTRSILKQYIFYAYQAVRNKYRGENEIDLEMKSQRIVITALFHYLKMQRS